MSMRDPSRNGLRERPVGELAKDLTSDLSLLVRQEIELAKAEMAQKARIALPGFVMFALAALIALCALGALTACLVLVFALFMPAWSAALLSGVLLMAAVGALVWMGKERIASIGTPIPEQTIETVKEDVEWAKTRAASARR